MASNEFARHNNNKNKEISRSGLLLPGEYLRNGERYSSFVFTVANGKSYATKRCNPRLCCCYRFWDIAVANIKIFDFDVKFARANSYMPASSHGIITIQYNYNYNTIQSYNELNVECYWVFVEFKLAKSHSGVMSVTRKFNVHHKIHTGGKPFACHVCEEMFTMLLVVERFVHLEASMA